MSQGILSQLLTTGSIISYHLSSVYCSLYFCAALSPSSKNFILVLFPLADFLRGDLLMPFETFMFKVLARINCEC